MKALPLLCRRAAAFLYDSLLMLAAFFLVTGIAVYVNGMEPVNGPVFLGALWLVAGLFLVLFWRNGRTLGMQAWKLRIVPMRLGADGSVDDAADAPAPHVRALAVRYALGSALFAITWAWMPFDRDGLALHDRLSRTRIVRGRG